MKAKKFLMAFAAIAAISTVSCTQDEELLTGSGNGPTPDEIGRASCRERV